jgi:hypothetical protein
MADVYKVGVSIILASNASAVLGLMAKQLTGINSQVAALAGGWGRAGVIIKGAMAVAAGSEVIKGYGKIVSHGEKLVHYQTQLRAAGYSSLQVQEATNRAFQTGSEILTSRYSDNLRDIHHLASITGNFDEAMRLSPAFAAVNQVMASLKDDHIRTKFAGDEMQTYDLARSLEVMGHTQQGPEVINQWTQAMSASMIAMRGLVDGHSFYNTVNNTGGAAMGYSKEFVSKVLPFLIQEMKSGAGNALYMLSRGFGQGVVTKGAAEGLGKYGLIKGPQDYLTDNSKRFLGLKPGSVAGSDVMASDPNLWVDNYLMPALKNHGVDTSNRQAVMAAIGEVSRNKNLTRILTTMAIQHDQIAKEMANVNRVLDSGGAEFLKTDPSIIKKSFFAQLDNLWTVLGSQQVAPAYEMLARLTNVIRDMARSLTLMPADKLRSIGYGIAGLGAALTTAGAAAILAAIGPAGWLVGGIAALALAVAKGGPHDDATNESRNRKEGSGNPGDDGSDLMGRVVTNAFAFVKAATPVVVEIFTGMGKAIKNAADIAANMINGSIGAITSALKNLGSAVAGAAAGIARGGSGGAGGNYDALGNPTGSPMRYTPPPGRVGGGAIHVHNYLDGQKIRSHLVKTIVAEASGPLQGATSYDQTHGHGGNDSRTALG